MYGARGPIGHICPSIPLDMITNEFQAVLRTSQNLHFDATYQLACEAADVIHMPWARMPVVRNIDAMERTTGLPVVTSAHSMV